MMQTLYFVLMVACVGWLLIWAALPEGSEDGLWWPFAMKDDGLAPPTATEPGDPGVPAGQEVVSWRQRAARATAQRPSKTDRDRRHAAAPAHPRRPS
ncbi:hypothetical protein AAFN86_06835 [Roseomonas sp. CAU 1739]|uniref:hypothetical protein n=1 Tax=Roseomonas sp. CAU 1739 TaxID=3140364 RepID=UPI00325B572E